MSFWVWVAVAQPKFLRTSLRERALRGSWAIHWLADEMAAGRG
jgi:hypothetical protein